MMPRLPRGEGTWQGEVGSGPTHLVPKALDFLTQLYHWAGEVLTKVSGTNGEDGAVRASHEESQGPGSAQTHCGPLDPCGPSFPRPRH